MDLTKDDFGMVFSILDCDKDGCVDPSEFVAQMHKIKTQDSHILTGELRLGLGMRYSCAWAWARGIAGPGPGHAV